MHPCMPFFKHISRNSIKHITTILPGKIVQCQSWKPDSSPRSKMTQFQDSFTSTFMQKIDGELICGICLELFEVPLLLPCGHSFCKNCIQGILTTASFRLFSSSPPSSFNCPFCQTRINAHNGRVDNLPINRYFSTWYMLILYILFYYFFQSQKCCL